MSAPEEEAAERFRQFLLTKRGEYARAQGRRRIGQVRFARHIGVPAGSYSKWELGEPPKDMQQLIHAARRNGDPPEMWLEAAGYSSSDVLGGEITGDLPETTAETTALYDPKRFLQLPVVGRVGDSTVAEINEDFLREVNTREGEIVRGILTVNAAARALLRTRSDRLLCDFSRSPIEGEDVIVEEADGTRRLVCYRGSGRNGIQVEAVGALGLGRTIEIEAEVIAVVDCYLSPGYR